MLSRKTWGKRAQAKKSMLKLLPRKFSPLLRSRAFRAGYNLELFQRVEPICQRNQPDKLHFIFLEGPPGAGKADVLSRLERLGFTTYGDFFRNTITEKGTISPISTLRWTTRMIDAINNFNSEFQAGKSFRNNTIFIHRSPLSPFIHQEEQFYKTIMAELRKNTTTSIIYCWADPIRQGERLAERDYWHSPEEKTQYAVLKEMDEEHIQELKKKYEKLWEAGVFDAELPTTSTKQANAHLLTMCGINFEPVFDLKTLLRE